MADNLEHLASRNSIVVAIPALMHFRHLLLYEISISLVFWYFKCKNHST